MKLEKLLLLVVLLLPVMLVQAQSGKIAGSVVDQNQDPLPGVNVVIEGTTTGTVSDSDGFFAILNVRPGRYTLRATFIGFTPVVIEDVRVGIDLTTEINIVLQEAAVGLDEVIVTSERPIIQRDISASERNMDAEELARGRYQTLQNVLTAQSSSTNLSSYDDVPLLRSSATSGRGDKFRRYSEVLVRVDGVNQGDPLTNQPNFKGGVLFVDSADKAARFIWTCNAFNIPLVFLSDVPGFMIGSEVERDGIIRHGAKMISAVAEATVPKLSVIVRKAYGAGLYAMAGPAFDPDYSIALPSAQVAVLGPEAAINAVFFNQIQEIEDADERAEFVERKRREARRRFLIGGAAALPVIITMGQKQALAASAAVCASHSVYADEDGDPNNSFFCHVN